MYRYIHMYICKLAPPPLPPGPQSSFSFQPHSATTTNSFFQYGVINAGFFIFRVRIRISGASQGEKGPEHPPSPPPPTPKCSNKQKRTPTHPSYNLNNDLSIYICPPSFSSLYRTNSLENKLPLEWKILSVFSFFLLNPGANSFVGNSKKIFVDEGPWQSFSRSVVNASRQQDFIS